MFTITGTLSEHTCVRQDDASDGVITGDGVDPHRNAPASEQTALPAPQGRREREPTPYYLARAGTRIEIPRAMPPVTKVLLLLLVLPAAVFDYRERRIPNWLVLAGIFAGTAMNAFPHLRHTPSATVGLLFSLEGFGLAFGVIYFLYLLRGMGAGDVEA